VAKDTILSHFMDKVFCGFYSYFGIKNGMKLCSKIIVFISLIISFNTCFALSKKDSLIETILKSNNHDTSKVNSYCSLVFVYLNESNADSGLICANKALTLSQKIGFKKGEGSAYNALGRYYYERAEYKTSIKKYEEAIKIFNELGLKLKEAKAMLGLAPNLSALGDIKKSLEYNLKALKIFESINEELETARAYSNIGNLYEKLEDRPQAIKNFEKCILLSRKLDNKKQLGTALYNLSRSQFAIKQFEAANKNIQEAYDIFKQINYKIGLSYVVQNLALIATEEGNFSAAEKYYNEGIAIAQENDDKNILGYSYGGLADIFMKQKKYNEAIEKLNIALPIANEIGNLELQVNLYDHYAQAYYAIGDYKKSIDNHRIYTGLKDSLFQANSSEKISEMQTKYDADKKDQENQLLTVQNNLSNETIKRQKTTGIIIACGLGLTLILLFFIFKGLQNQKRANKIIELQKQETENQKLIVEEKNKEITDSIVYASRIQNAMLTSEAYIKRYFNNVFILFKPKDIVSGDFYWCYHENNTTFFVTADCTGHGVPGAMMSMLSINLLNEIISERNITEPDIILNVMRKEIIKALNSKDSIEEANDGLDCSIIAFNHDRLTIQYACANNSFYIIRNGEIMNSYADKMPVGKSPREEVGFELKELQLQKEDLIVTLTDGYADQFGGAKGKKYKYKQLEEVLLKNTTSSMNEIKAVLNHSIEDWKGNLEQVDDICVIGIKI